MSHMCGSEKWLDAYQDPGAMLYTFSSGLCLADLHGDGEYRLVAADLGTGTYNMRLKVYKGIHLVSEHTIVDLPTGLVAFHMETCDPRAAAIAVASGGNIYVYKNMRPFYKFTLPGLDIHPGEAELWDKTREVACPNNSSVSKSCVPGLTSRRAASLQDPRGQYTGLLRLEPEELEQFVQFHQQFPLKRQTVITCLTTMKKSLAEETALSCLVLGTESRQVYVLEPNAFTILSVMALASVPVFLDVSGLFDVEYSIVAACRDAALYTLKRLFCKPRGVQGKCVWTLPLDSAVTAIAAVTLEHLSVAAVAVATDDGALRLYQDRLLCDVIAPPGGDPVVGLRFGRFGREENTLILVTKGGCNFVCLLAS
ncbi:BBS1 [Cordylochernes scorpioides]|uniref:BBS1 n=1 Tax=Cordylochernes scorpioides TaxID=51811 RepID=A0ABY6L177_9ARAC|nr:BBS1 [Cordylochernes scorpioides]